MRSVSGAIYSDTDLSKMNKFEQSWPQAIFKMVVIGQ